MVTISQISGPRRELDVLSIAPLRERFLNQLIVARLIESIVSWSVFPSEFRLQPFGKFVSPEVMS